MIPLEDAPEFQKLLRLFHEMPPNRQQALLNYLEHEDTRAAVHEPDDGLTLSPELTAMIARFHGLPEQKQCAILELLAHESTTGVAHNFREVCNND